MFEYPNPLGGFQETTSWFYDVFGFDAAQTVTIMGAHTLGRMHTPASGFISQWAIPHVVHL